MKKLEGYIFVSTIPDERIKFVIHEHINIMNGGDKPTAKAVKNGNKVKQ